MIDTHCHLDDVRFDNDRETVWSEAKRAGISLAILPAVHPQKWEALAQCANESPRDRAFALGIHPYALATLSLEEEQEALEQLAERAQSLGAIAIGECGLDKALQAAHPDDARVSLDRQVKCLKNQLAIARELRLPVLLHAVKAHDLLFETLRFYGDFPAGGVLHSYSGGSDRVLHYGALGMYFSFAGSITRPNAKKPIEALRKVPRDRLLFESDAPDQIPSGTGISGDRCEPAHLRYTLTTAANLLKCSVEELEAQTDTNALRLFRP